MEVVVTSKQGKVLRKATPSESRRFRNLSKTIEVPEKVSKIKKLKIERMKARTIAERGKIPIKEQLKIPGRTLAITIGETAIAFKQLPGTIKGVVKNPIKTAKSVPGGVKKEAKTFARLLKVSPTEAVAKITGKTATRLSPKFKGIKKSKIVIPSIKKGKSVEIKIAGPVKTIKEPVSKQVRLAGKRVTAVTAARDLFKPFRKKVKIAKPKPSPTAPELEKALFADPYGRLRPSRLGVGAQKEAGLLDILSGDVTLKKAKPQVIFFEGTPVENFPKSLKGIANKLKKGKRLTNTEQRKLMKWQLKKSGKFKPIGFISKEPEITLAPGEIIKKQKVVGVTLINGERVPIIRAVISKPTKATQKLLRKARAGKLSKKEINKLQRKLSKETGFKFSRNVLSKPRVPIKRLGISGLSRIIKPSKKIRISKKISLKRKKFPIRIKRIKRKVSPRKKPSKKISKPIKPSPKPSPKPSKKKIIRGAPSPRPRVKPPVRPPVIIRKLKRKIRKPKLKARSYHIYVRPLKKRKGQRKPKLIRVTRKPVKKSRARDIGSFLVDRSIARTYKVVGSKGKPKKTKLKVPYGYASKTKHKFRSYKIVKGKRISLRNKFIERRGKSLIDTRGEKRGLTARMRLAQLRRQSGIRPIKRKRKSTKKKRIKRKSLSPQVNLNKLLKV